jgi:hypothetical protein
MSFFDPLHVRWEVWRQRPFWRLVELFLARIFRGGGDSDSEGLDIGVGLVLTLLAVPGGFVSILLFDKYGSLLQWLRGQTNVDPLRIAFPDEYFFIVLSMTVTGAVAVWRWDAIFPDRRDYINLVPLPISTRTIFFANLVAVLLLVSLVAIDVNAASCILFPMVVAAAQSKFVFALKFAAVHALGVISSSIFAFLAVFATLGVLMAVFPPAAFRRISTHIRGCVMVYLVALLCTSFLIPDVLRRVRGPAPFWTFLLPSCWFAGVCQSLRDRATPAMMELARLTFPGIAVLGVIALGMYAVSYRRHFLRIAEMMEGTAATHIRGNARLDRLLDRFLLRTPFRRACFRFVRSTLLRSEPHRLMLTGIAGLALVLASQALMEAFEGTKSLRRAALTPAALSIPFILGFLIVAGMRLVFEIPVELRANWIFQLMLDRDRQESAPLAGRVILLAVLPWILAINFPVYLYLEGIAIASLHTLLVVTWTMLLTNIVLVRFRKLPFTCTLPVFKQHSIVIVLSFCFGYLVYAVSTPEFESSALLEPLRLLSLLPVVSVAWYIPRYLAKSTIDIEKRLIFEESPTQTVEALRLSD